MGFGSDLLDRRPLGRRPPAAHGGGREKGRERGGKVVCGGWFGGEAEEEEGHETEATAPRAAAPRCYGLAPGFLFLFGL